MNQQRRTVKRKKRRSGCGIILFPLFLVVLFAVLLIVTAGKTTASGVMPEAPMSADTGASLAAAGAVAPETTRLSFIGAGDNITHGWIYIQARAYAAGTDKAYDFSPMFTEIADFVADADIAFLNQETIMGGDELGISGYPRFNSPREMGDTVVSLGFDVINLATNHLCDRYEAGIAGTLDYWDKQPVLNVGAYRDEADFDNIRVYEKDGVKIAFLAYTYGTNGLTLPKSSKYIIPYIDDDTMTRQVAAAKELSDLVFVSLHWGNEDNFKPSAAQTHVAELLASLNVDAIIGHHPHVVQKVEWLDRPDGGRMLCVYSLGNLISTMLNGRNMVGGIITFDIVKTDDGYNTKAWLENPIFVPTVTYYNSRNKGNKVYFMKDFTEELAKTHGCLANDSTFSLARAKKYIIDYIPSEFLPDYLK